MKIKALKDQGLKDVCGGMKFGESYCHARDGRRFTDYGSMTIGPGKGWMKRDGSIVPRVEVDDITLCPIEA